MLHYIILDQWTFLLCPWKQSILQEATGETEDLDKKFLES